VIVDANTGRGLQGTRWEKGLHNVSRFLADACRAVHPSVSRKHFRELWAHIHFVRWSACGILRNNPHGSEGDPNAMALSAG
jgi:hypothetical protein